MLRRPFSPFAAHHWPRLPRQRRCPCMSRRLAAGNCPPRRHRHESVAFAVIAGQHSSALLGPARVNVLLISCRCCLSTAETSNWNPCQGRESSQDECWTTAGQTPAAARTSGLPTQRTLWQWPSGTTALLLERCGGRASGPSPAEQQLAGSYIVHLRLFPVSDGGHSSPMWLVIQGGRKEEGGTQERSLTTAPAKDALKQI
jgi:hypothetical protein